MAIILPHPMNPQEMRVLQEFRRIPADTLSVAAIKAIKHPSGGGESPAVSLVAKGYLTTDSSSETFTLTEKAKAFLALDPKPEFEETAKVASDAE
ncbi:MAG: hypothetical protein JJE51_05350 [Thermoanaerobaculia bacterium]|nr:hypothetical protein [Thermoanaerobaculia bacterium]